MSALTKERLFMPRTGAGDKLLGTRLKARRIGLGMELEEIAEGLRPKAAPRTVRSWEDGVHSPGVDILRQLANLLQTTVAYLVGEVDNPMRPSDRLRRIGLDPGNFDQMSDEAFGAALVGLIEQFTARSTKRALPSSRQQGGLDAEGGSGTAASAS